MAWHYIKDGAQEGPVDEATLQGFISAGEVDVKTLAWKEGMADWLPIEQIGELSASGTVAPVAAAQVAAPALGSPIASRPSAGQHAIGQVPVPNYLVWSILSTLFCCLPFGIVSIVFAAKVDGLVAQGQRDQAIEASNNAKKWAKYSAFITLGAVALYLIFAAVMFGVGATSSAV